METLMVLTYTAFCYAIFKAFKIPLNSYTVPTAVLGGVVLIGTMLLVMNYNHPYTKYAQSITVTTPIVPSVSGRVIDVPVEANKKVEQGDMLFQIDPIPFQNKVDELSAQLVAAQNQVNVKKLQWEQSLALREQAESERNRAKDNYDRYVKANSQGNSKPYSQAQIQNQRDTFNSAEANLAAARAQEAEDEASYLSQINGIDTDVARINAQLEQAYYDLEQATVLAPTDGLVTQLALREGAMAVKFPVRPSMVFVHDEAPKIVASFQQNYALRLEEGADAEIIFASLPGDLITGKVKQVLPVVRQGSIQASGTLIAVNEGQPDRIPVIIELDNPADIAMLPAGSRGEVAILTEHFHHVALIRRILLRMKSWRNYIFGEGH